MATQSYGSAPGRRTSTAASAPARRSTKPKPLVATAMKRRAPAPKGK